MLAAADILFRVTYKRVCSWLPLVLLPPLLFPHEAFIICGLLCAQLIVSLLETTDNDLQRAYALVRVVNDTNTGLHNPKSGGPMSKRKRCPDGTCPR